MIQYAHPGWFYGVAVLCMLVCLVALAYLWRKQRW